jgi:predicted O-methyltransferase YrrM
MIRAAPAWMTSRLYFAQLCNDHGLTGTAVEVGTHLGGFASAFLRDWKGHTLFCIDHYPDFEGSNRAADFGQAMQALRSAKKEGQSFEFIREPSLEAVKRFRPGSVDFVYVDGDHSFEAVLADLNAWWGPLAPGGILAGHDVVCFAAPMAPDNWGLAVQSAIMNFTHRLPDPVDCFIVIEQLDLTFHGAPWSYYFQKPKP